MSRRSLFVTIDLAAALLMLAMLASGYVLWFVLPPGSNRTHAVWSIARHTWGEIHGWTGTGLLAIVAIHLALHWRWFVDSIYRTLRAEAFARRAPARAALSLVAAVALMLVLFGMSAHYGKAALDHPRHGGGRMAGP